MVESKGFCTLNAVNVAAGHLLCSSPMISLHGLSAVMGTLQVGHWPAFFNHTSMQDEQNTW